MPNLQLSFFAAIKVDAVYFMRTASKRHRKRQEIEQAGGQN